MSFSDVSRALAQPVRYRILARYLAQIGLVIILLRIPPMLVAWLTEDWLFILTQLVNTLMLLLICWPLSRLQVPADVRDNEIMVISALSFVFAALLEAIPLADTGLSAMDALFEAVSGVTTTGLSTMTQLEDYPTRVLFSRAWMQWYGGLGVVIFSIALLLLDRSLSVQRLIINDTSDIRDILGNARGHSLKLLGTYSALTAAIVAVLWLAGLSPLNAVTYALSGISTGGFAISDNSLAAISSGWLQCLVALSGFLGAISLTVYYRFVHDGGKAFVSNPETLALPVMTLVTATLLFLCADGGTVLSRLNYSVVMGISAQSTTGFASVDVAGLNDASKLSLIFSMLIGGSMGSTAGGVKLLRFLIVLRLLQFFIVRTALPAHAVLEKSLAGDKLEADQIERVLLLVTMSVATVLCSWLPFLLYGYAPLDALFEVVSACSTTGLSAGISRTALEPLLKLVLMVDMLLGRVEFLAFLVFLYPRTWIKIGNK